MTKGKGIRRPRRPHDVSILDWITANSHIEPGPLPTPCLVWDGVLDRKGYGKMTVDRRTRIVHRTVWIERHGPVPADKPFILHRCDNRRCIADDHLWPGTNRENVADMLAKGRFVGNRYGEKTHCLRGHPFDEANTVRTEKGRKCKTCRREYDREYKRARYVPASQRGHTSGT